MSSLSEMSKLKDECQKLYAKFQKKSDELKRLQDRERELSKQNKHMQDLQSFRLALQSNWESWMSEKDWIEEEVQELPGCENIGCNPEIAKLLNDTFGRHFTFKYERDYQDYPRLCICPRFKIQQCEVELLKESGDQEVKVESKQKSL